MRLEMALPPDCSLRPEIVLTRARRLLDVVFEPGRRPPFVEHAQIAEAVGPAHAGPGEFLPPGKDRLAGGVDLEGIEPAVFR